MKNSFSIPKLDFLLKIELSCLLLIGCLSCGKNDGSTISDSFSGPGEFTTLTDQASISGTLFLPNDKGPFPVIVIVPGSGNEPKEDSYGFTDIFLPQGIAVYFYDKRGIGESTGSYSIETLETASDFLVDRSRDVISIVELLAKHTDININQIGIFGASQGAWVNSIVFDENDKINFMLMSVGGVAPTGIENYYNELTNDDPDLSITEATELLNSYDGPLGFDPLPIIQEMEIPVIWIYGGKDRSHPTFYDIDILEELNKNNFSIFLFENSDHELEDEVTSEFDPNLIPSILSWLDQNVIK